MSVEQSLLGKDTNYPTEYQPEILYPISRAPARENMLILKLFNKVRTGGIFLKYPG